MLKMKSVGNIRKKKTNKDYMKTYRENKKRLETSSNSSRSGCEPREQMTGAGSVTFDKIEKIDTIDSKFCKEMGKSNPNTAEGAKVSPYSNEMNISNHDESNSIVEENAIKNLKTTNE